MEAGKKRISKSLLRYIGGVTHDSWTKQVSAFVVTALGLWPRVVRDLAGRALHRALAASSLG